MRKEYYSEADRQLLFSLYDSSKMQKKDQFRNHKHINLELGFIISGNGQYSLNQVTHEANSGDLFVVRPNEQHCIPTIISSKLISFNIHITSYYLWNICTDFIEPEKIQMLIQSEIPIHCHFIKNDNINTLLKKIWELFHTDADSNRFKIRSYVLELIKIISKEIIVAKSNTDLSSMQLHNIQQAINFIKQNYNRPITLDDIAHAATMSRSHLTNTFKLVSGTTPYEYLLSTRIEKASNLLIESNRSILQISHDCGFNNITNFNRAFKQKMGETPSSLRLRYKN